MRKEELPMITKLDVIKELQDEIFNLILTRKTKNSMENYIGCLEVALRFAVDKRYGVKGSMQDAINSLTSFRDDCLARPNSVEG
jgi:hypothetical protein